MIKILNLSLGKFIILKFTALMNVVFIPGWKNYSRCLQWSSNDFENIKISFI